MSDTAYLFIIAAIWSVIVAAFAFFVPNWPARIVVFALLVGIPFWELPYGYYNFQKLCREEAKLIVTEKIPPQRIVCTDYPFVGLHTDLLRAGIPIVESRWKTGEIKRYTREKNGEILETPQTFIASTYCLTYVNNIDLPWRVLRHDTQIVRAQDGGRLVGRQSRFDWGGMWWQQMAHPLLGRGGRCFDDPIKTISALRQGSG